MIGKDEIAEACRYADALAEEHQDLPAYWQERGVDIAGLSYVAMQRGLRAVMMLRGENPNLTRPTRISLTRGEERLQTAFAASFMDGFAARDRIEREETT
jgi:hypothetical protein